MKIEVTNDNDFFYGECPICQKRWLATNLIQRQGKRDFSLLGFCVHLSNIETEGSDINKKYYWVMHE